MHVRLASQLVSARTLACVSYVAPQMAHSLQTLCACHVRKRTVAFRSPIYTQAPIYGRCATRMAGALAAAATLKAILGTTSLRPIGLIPVSTPDYHSYESPSYPNRSQLEGPQLC